MTKETEPGSNQRPRTFLSMENTTKRLRTAAFLGMLGACCLTALAAEPPPAPAAGDKAVENAAQEKSLADRMRTILPGITINSEENLLDVEASICLGEGFLELIACTKDSKEHESVVVIAAKPQHIHAGLLLLGARPGNPATRKLIDEQERRWIDIPPQGDPIKVSLVFKNKEGKLVERPISDFVERSGDEADLPSSVTQNDDDAKFPDSFLFAGSLLVDNGEGPKQYLCDLNGNVISIATFGDELLCLSGNHAQDNGALEWQINSTHLPEVGTKVLLRLRPPATAAAKRAASPTPAGPPADTKPD